MTFWISADLRLVKTSFQDVAYFSQVHNGIKASKIICYLKNCLQKKDPVRALTKVFRQSVFTFLDTKQMNTVGPVYAAPLSFAVLHMCKIHKISGKWLFKVAKGIH